MKLLEFFTLMLLPLSGGTELIDFVPAKLYWSLKGIPLTSETMRAELQTKTAGDVSALIKQLGDAKFQLRRKAMQELLAKGPGVIPQLQRAAKSKDREIATRSRQLLQRLTQNRGESRVRRLMAVKALGRLKHRLDLPVLRKLLKSTDPALAAVSRRAIAEIEGRPFKRKAVTRKQLDEDLWLLPKNCGLVAQLAIRKTIPVDADRMIKQFVAGSSKKNPNEMLRKFRTQLLKLINAAGNLRIDAVTLGVSAKIGPNVGFVVMIGRGFYDRAAAVRVFKKAKLNVVRKQGFDVVSIENDVLLLLVSNSRVILMVSPNNAAMVLEEMLKSLKTGRGKLAENRPMTALIKSADRSGLLWGVSRKGKWYKETSVLAP
ncbi:MAG: HEAT repeat domain-containing protein, partial [Planctomycetes bacterium]|nr:HEAT repeat domain-containing protein [Planctomycetota bacterium]